MRRSPIYDLCLAIQFIPQEFANLQVTREEFLCMKAIILLNTGKRQPTFWTGPVTQLLPYVDLFLFLHLLLEVQYTVLQTETWSFDDHLLQSRTIKGVLYGVTGPWKRFM